VKVRKQFTSRMFDRKIAVWRPRAGKSCLAWDAVELASLSPVFYQHRALQLASHPHPATGGNQLRALVGWGQMLERRLCCQLRCATTFLAEPGNSSNGTCCGISVEHHRLALGPVRSENQFRVALLIANLGTFGTLATPGETVLNVKGFGGAREAGRTNSLPDGEVPRGLFQQPAMTPG